jgi:oligoendopeptidase F
MAAIILERRERKFLPVDFTVTDWENLKPYFELLLHRDLSTKEQLETWLQDVSELEAVISEDACWRQIRMTCDTTDKALEASFTYFCMEIEPKMKPLAFQMNQKLLECPFIEELDKNLYFPYLRSVKNAASLYREANVMLQAEAGLLAQRYGSITGAMTIEEDGKEYTLQQAAKFLQSSDRALRESVYKKISSRRMQDKDALNDLFDKLLEIRHQIAVNAGFDNYRDYKFKELGRFDYTPEDCFDFHEAVKAYILPIQKKLTLERKKRLGTENFYPWDADAEPAGTEPLRPFVTGAELLEKAIKVFGKEDAYFESCLETMRDLHRLDLESRKGKAPGGYNCPLAETGVPFIFMNAAGTMGDLITMMHEGGHAVHSFLSHDLRLQAFKEYPMEIAELASMSMELFSMSHWDVFFDDAATLKRAQLEELERVIGVLPWIATIDKYQHWLYTHAGHSVEERESAWMAILDEFSTGVTDWTGLEDYRAYLWQKQLHLYEVPFYYIEYGIAQLGAIAMWKQFRADRTGTIAKYKQALALGNTKTLGELYATAGIEFNFSPAYVQQLGAFTEGVLREMGIE